MDKATWGDHDYRPLASSPRLRPPSTSATPHCQSSGDDRSRRDGLDATGSRICSQPWRTVEGRDGGRPDVHRDVLRLPPAPDRLIRARGQPAPGGSEVFNTPRAAQANAPAVDLLGLQSLSGCGHWRGMSGDLRHTFVTRPLESGRSFSEVARLAGWSASTAVRMSYRYGHLSEGTLREAISELERPVFRRDSAENHPEQIYARSSSLTRW